MSPEAKLDLILDQQRTILEGIGLILTAIAEYDSEDPEEDGFDMQTVGPEQ
jgi:hypothetical protein